MRKLPYDRCTTLSVLGLLCLQACAGAQTEYATNRGATQATALAVPWQGDDEAPMSGLLLGGMQAPGQGGDAQKAAAQQPKEGTKDVPQQDAKRTAATSAATRYGLRIHHIDGDGNCLFRAIADQLQGAPFSITFSSGQDYHHIVRQLAVAHVRAHRAAYQRFFPNDNFRSLEDWLTRMSHDKVWGGQVALRALSDALQVTLVAIRAEAKRSERPTIYKPAQSSGIIYLHFRNGNHYESLSRLASMSAEQQEQWQKLQGGIEWHEASSYVPPKNRTLQALICEQEGISGTKDAAGSAAYSKHGAAGKAPERTRAEHNDPHVRLHDLLLKVNSTKELLASPLLGELSAKDERVLETLLDEYNSQMDGQQWTRLKEEHLLEYSLLAGIRATDKLMPSLKKYVQVWEKRMNEGFDRDEYAKGIVKFLCLADESLFAGDPTLLLRLGTALAAQLPADGSLYNPATYAAHRDMLAALHQTILKISSISPMHKLDGRDRRHTWIGELQAKLRQIAEATRYYPAQYDVKLVQQSLLRHSDASARGTDNYIRIYRGIKGGAQLLTGLFTLPLETALALTLSPLTLESGLANLVSAGYNLESVEPEDVLKRLLSSAAQKECAWYDDLQALDQLALSAILDQEKLTTYQRALAAVTTAEHLRKLGAEDRAYFQYGLVQQLTAVGLASPAVGVSKQCLAALLGLLRHKPWQTHQEVVQALLSGTEQLLRRAHNDPKARDRCFEQVQQALSSYLAQKSKHRKEGVAKQFLVSTARIAAHCSAPRCNQYVGWLKQCLEAELKDGGKRRTVLCLWGLAAAQCIPDQCGAAGSRKALKASSADLLHRLAKRKLWPHRHNEGVIHAWLGCKAAADSTPELLAKKLQAVAQAIEQQYCTAPIRRSVRAQETHFLFNRVKKALEDSDAIRSPKAKQVGFDTPAGQQQLAEWLAGPRLDAAQLQAFDQPLKAAVAKAVTKADFDERIAKVEEALKKCRTARVRKQLTDMEENIDDNYRGLLGHLANVKDSLAKLVTGLHSRVEGVMALMIQQREQGAQRQLTTGQVQQALGKAQQAFLKDCESQQAKYSEVLRQMGTNLQKAIIAKLEAIEKEQGRALKTEDLQKVLSDVKLIKTALGGIAAKVKAVLSKARAAEAQREDLAEEIVGLINTHVTKELDKGLLKTEASLTGRMNELKKMVASLAIGLQGPSFGGAPAELPLALTAVTQSAVMRLDATRGMLVSRYFPSIRQVLHAAYATDVNLVKLAKRKGERLHAQGKDWEADGEPNTAEKRYERAIEAYERALKYFPAPPGPSDALSALYQAVEGKLKAARADLARVSGAPQADAKEVLTITH